MQQQTRSIEVSEGSVTDGLVVPSKIASFDNECVKRRLEKFEKYLKTQNEKLAQLKSREISITLPDGKVVKGESFKTTPLQIATNISKKLAERMMVARVKYENRDKGLGSDIVDCDAEELTEEASKSELVDLSLPLEGDCSLELLDFTSEEGVQTFWHSSAHIIGNSLEKHLSGYLTHGPPLKEGGFFYDIFAGQKKVVPEDYEKLEALANEVIKQNSVFERVILSKQEALDLFVDNPFKVKLIEAKIHDNAMTTAYRCGDLIDLCTGPHLPSTGRVKVVKVLKNSASYWLANQKNDVLQRVYAISYPSKKEMDIYLLEQEELAKRDHRNILEQQSLVHFNNLAPGCAFYLPHGTRLFNRLIEFMRKQYTYRGFSEVNTPNMFKTDLWKMSGHYFKYREDMFFVKTEDEEHGLKPMNCPSHCLMFGSTLRSYRDLPIRMADFGVLHRNELSGALSGMTRVRKFHQDDAHIFCRNDQIMDEIVNQLEFVEYVYSNFGFEFSVELSTRPEKYLGTIDMWDSAEKSLTEALNKTGKPWKLNPGDGAFYGPKIDIKVLDCYKRKHQLGTVQLDFNLPQRFNLQFKSEGTPETEEKVDESQPQTQAVPKENMTEEEKYSVIGKLKHGFERPIIIHRAILGSLERCIAILTEHFGGKWPFWLSPRQIMVIPISAKLNEFAERVKNRFVLEGYYADFDNNNLTLNKKIRNAQLQQYNFILIIGEKEAASNSVNVRVRDEEKERGSIKINEFLEELKSLAPKPSAAELAIKNNAFYD